MRTIETGGVTTFVSLSEGDLYDKVNGTDQKIMYKADMTEAEQETARFLVARDIFGRYQREDDGRIYYMVRDHDTLA